MRIIARVNLLGALGQPVERRNRQIKMAVLDEFGHLAKEKGDEQGRDMGAVDIGVGHDDDFFVAKICVLVMRAGAASQRLNKIAQLLISGELVARGVGDVEDFSAQRQHGLGGAVARLFGRSARRIALDDEEFRSLRRIVRAIRELSWEPELARRGFARDIFFGAAAGAFLGAFDRPIEEFGGVRRRRRKPMIEGIAHDSLDDPGCLIGQKPAFVLALKFRLAKKDRDHRGAGRHDVIAGDERGAFRLPGAFRMILEGPRQRGAQPCFMGAAVGGRNGIAIGTDKAIVEGEPGHGPFERSMTAVLLDLARENLIGDEVLALRYPGEGSP